MHLGQGKNCKWVLSSGTGMKEFATDSALDSYLEKHVEDFNGEELPFFSMDLQDEAIKTLDKIKVDYDKSTSTFVRSAEDPSEIEEIIYVPNSIGVNRYNVEFGRVPKFNIESWKSKFVIDSINESRSEFVERFIKEGKGDQSAAEQEFIRLGLQRKAENDAQQDIKDQEEILWPALTQYGEKIHKIIENTINGVESTLDEINSIGDESDKLTESHLKQIQNWSKNLLEILKNKYGATAKFYTEFAFKTKFLDPSAQALMGNINSIVGKADLLVLDQFGQVHVFDFKVSRKNVGHWSKKDNKVIAHREYSDDWKENMGEYEGEWGSAKKYAITNQLAMYTAILRQHGLHVKSAGVIPIKLDFAYESEFKIKDLQNIKLPSESEILFNIPGTTAGDEYNYVTSNVVNVPKITFNKDMEVVFDQYKQVLPGVGVTSSVARTVHEDLDWYKKNRVNTVGPSDTEHYGKYKWVFYKSGTSDKKPVYCNDDTLDSELSNYIQELITIRSNEVSELANLISDALSNSEQDIDKIVGSIPVSKQATYKTIMKKYIHQGWTFESDDTLASAGIFIFTRGAETEIITVTNELLFNLGVNLPFGTTILGKTTRNKDVKLKSILEASHGKLEIIKTLIYIANNQDWFRNKKITNIRVVNPWQGQVEDTVLNEQALENYEQLRVHNPGVLPKLDHNLFSNDFQALYKFAKSMMEDIDPTLIDFDETKYDARKVESLKTWVTTKMAEMRSDPKFKDKLNDKSSYNKHDEVWHTYNFLGQILLRLNGLSTKSELDKGKWFQSKASPTGVFFASPQQSSSINIQDFAKIHDRYVAEVRQMQQKLGWELQVAFNELYKSEGSGAGVFDACFRRDSNGKISEGFLLKNPDDPEFDGKPQLRKVMTLFLETMFKLKNPSATEFDINEAKTHIEYYQVPLTEAVFSRQAKHLGVWSAIKNKVKQYKELTQGVFAGDADKKEEFESENDKLYNKFAISEIDRQNKIRDNGIGFFETHLEIIFNQALVSYTKQNVSAKYVPIFRAMQLGLRHHDAFGHNGTPDKKKLEGIQEAVDKFIQNRFYGKPIMDKWQQPIYAWLSVISQFFSTLRLGLNIRSFCREMLNGLYISTTRVMSKQMEGITQENYVKALTHIIQDVPNNLSGISKLQQLNAIYGMANYSLGNVANQRRLNWLNIKNWSRDTLFVGCSAPDYNHRMAILIAKMIGDGCWDAHSLNDEGELVYDFKKDKRFEAYIKGDTSDPKYIEQKTLYLKNIEEWNAQGYTKSDGTFLQEGDDLPNAYTNREGQSVKNYADLLYGHYDDESRGLINDMFLGSFFMQFKTFITAKLEQWTMKEGIYNIEHLKQQYDPIDNEKLYEIVVYPDGDMTNMPYREIIKESELENRTEEERKNARPYVEWTGQPMEGMLQSMVSFGNAVKNMDQKKLQELWNNPHDRGLLLIGLSDMFICALLFVLIKALYGSSVGSDDWDDINKDVKDAGYLTSFSYSVLTGFAQDGPPSAIISSMLGDMNPPLITNVQQFTDSCLNVVTGKSTVTYALTKQIGLLSDFSGIVKEKGI